MNFAVADDVQNPRVKVTDGVLRGRLLPDGHGRVFKGIPFARPPVGELRWREPLPVVPWIGERDSSVSGPPAAQASFGWNESMVTASKEDCLYLDVWAPGSVTDSPRRPVMVWVHGGGNVGGAGGFDPLYEGTHLIDRGVVLVVVEYRLGVFGFFAHPELSRESPDRVSGNYGLLDQIAALRWVHDNIARFGGDPANVTLFGQSAGSFDVVALLASPLTQGLFHHAIAESGAPAGPGLQSLADAEQAGVKFAAKLNLSEKDQLAQLRALNAADLLKFPTGISPFIADGRVFLKAAAEVLPPGAGHRVPLLIGSNAIEFPVAGSVDQQRTVIRETFRDLEPKALARYALNDEAPPLPVDPLYGDAATQLGSDLFRGPAVVQGERHSLAGNAVWEYEFDRAIPPHPHAGHSGELPYVFGNLFTQGSQGGDFQAADRQLSALVQSYWVNFARTGNPNGAGLPDWPAYDAKARKFIRFTTDGGTEVGENQRGPFLDLFRELFATPPLR